LIGRARRAALVVAFFAALSASASERPAVDYFYIPGSEGASSGGHAALRLGAWVYDFQYEDGLVRLRREDSNQFQHVYRALENRDLELTRVRVEPETFERLRQTFDRRRLVEERRIAIAGALRRDRELLEALYAESDASSGPAGVSVEGVGFFFADGSPVPASAPGGSGTGPEVLHRLRDRIAAQHGPGWLSERWREIDAGLAALRPAAPELDAIDPDPLRYATRAPRFARRYHQRVAGRFALALLRAPKDLRIGSLGPDLGPAGLLSPAERARLAELSEALLDAMVRLAVSPRPDWAQALLLGMARLAALETSLTTGRLVPLDPFPRGASTLAMTAPRRARLPALLAQQREALDAALIRLAGGGGWRESDWNAVEVEAARWAELRAARDGASRVRLLPSPSIPDRAGWVVGLPRPAVPPDPVAGLIADARARERHYAADLDERQGYNLVTRNCVSEIFRTIDLAFAGGGSEADARRASVRDLGGYVHPTDGMNFIPFMSSRHVRARWRVGETSTLPSYRHHRIEEQVRSEPAWRVALRESNVVTATTHHPSGEAGFFLFFTEDAGPLRPLLGALNLVAGLGRASVGLLAWPFDGGSGLRAGLEGAFFSLPELVFQSLRKGTNDWVPPDETPPPG
jgi:hypothetical protein